MDDEESYLCPRCRTVAIQIDDSVYSLDEREVEMLKHLVELFPELDYDEIEEVLEFARLKSNGETLSEVN